MSGWRSAWFHFRGGMAWTLLTWGLRVMPESAERTKLATAILTGYFGVRDQEAK